jgi:type VI secretion system protein VasG
MSEIRRTTLFSKLNPLAYKSVEGATLFCKMRGNPYVELVHWIHQILQGVDSDLHRIVRHFELDAARVAAELTAALDRLPRGATAISDFSPHLEESIERGWLYASLLFNGKSVRTGHLIIGILKTPSIRNVFLGMSREFSKIKIDTLSEQFSDIVSGSPEDIETLSETAPSGTGEAAPAVMGKQEALGRFSVDLTERARKGEIDPVLGRDEEIRQVIDILMRRRQNNPLLAGEAGVGKTAVVEGFAMRIAKGDVPPALREVTLRSLDLGLLQAGASVKGEFENRLRQVIEEVQASPKPIILFIDEAHMLIGAGGAAGQGDAANLLKPALARGTLRTIAATTWAEYKKYIEKDPALTRRFQAIKVEEPTEDVAVRMIRGLAGTLEKHHGVLILDEALESAARLSHRYIPARQLPDKAVSLIDTACARVAVSQHATPARLEDTQRQIEMLETEIGILDREAALGREDEERRKELQKKLEEQNALKAELEARYQKELAIVERIRNARNTLSARKEPGARSQEPEVLNAGPSDEAVSKSERETALAELRAAEAELRGLQGEDPLILPDVDAQAVASVVSDWTGIPVGRMVKNEIQAVLNLNSALEKRVVGQNHALDAIARRIQTARAGLDNPSKPVGVFLLAGPSGVGKTETALALAETLYGGEANLITINMSEFQEAHTVSTLKGSPPGYVGYGEGGVLTEAVRRRPYSVVLLDEVEKAHPDVHEIFFQVFDKGMMEDGEGRRIDFKNTIILLTSNVGSDLIMRLCSDHADIVTLKEKAAEAAKSAENAGKQSEASKVEEVHADTPTRPDADTSSAVFPNPEPGLSDEAFAKAETGTPEPEPESQPEPLPSRPDPEDVAAALRPQLLKVFPAALLGRLTVVPYYPLDDEVLKSIIELQLSRIQKRLRETHNAEFSYTRGVVQLIAARCTELESGGRMIDAILTQTLLPDISREFLTRQMEGKPVKKVRVLAGSNGSFVYQFDDEQTGIQSASQVKSAAVDKAPTSPATPTSPPTEGEPAHAGKAPSESESD